MGATVTGEATSAGRDLEPVISEDDFDRVAVVRMITSALDDETSE